MCRATITLRNPITGYRVHSLSKASQEGNRARRLLVEDIHEHIVIGDRG